MTGLTAYAVSMAVSGSTGLAAHLYGACMHFLLAANEGLDSIHTQG